MPSPKNRTVDLIAVYQRHERTRLREARKIGTEYDALFRETVGFYTDKLNATLAGTAEKSMLDHYFRGSCQQYALLYQYRRLLGEAAPWEDLAQAGIYALAELCAVVTKIAHGSRLTPWPAYAEGMGYLAMTDRPVELRRFFDLFRGALDTPLTKHMDRDGFPTLAFLFFLLADWYGVSVDRSAEIFADPAKMPDSLTALKEWRTPDLDRLDALVSAMADFHIRNSQGSLCPYVWEDFDGDSSFPYEILAWLRIREWAGLENPTHFSHPLMQGVQAVLPPRGLPRPEMPLLKAVMDKFHDETPEHNALDQLRALW